MRWYHTAARTWRKGALAAGMVLVTSLAGCEGGAVPAGDAPTPVTVHPAERGLPDAAHYSATIAAVSVVRVASHVDGAVMGISQVEGADGQPRDLQPGDAVSAGDLLVWVEDDTYRDQLAEAEDQLAADIGDMLASKDEADRYIEAGDAVALARTENLIAMYEASKAKVARAQHQVDDARIQLDWCTIEAPSAGVVLHREVEVGDLVRSGSEVLQIGDTRRVKAVFAVPAELAVKLHDGLVLDFTVEALDDREFAGPITEVAPSADPTSRLFDVEVTFANPDQVLDVGMVAALEMSGDLQTLVESAPLLVPLDAIVRPPGDPRGFAVYVLEPADGDVGADRGVARLQPVDVGDVIRAQVAITGGLQPGEQVIVRGSTLVHPGDTVRVIP